MWKKMVHRPWTAKNRSYMQRCSVRWTIGTASGNQRKPEGYNKRSYWSTSSLEKKWVYSWTRANRGCLIYKFVIFLYSVSVLFPLLRVSAGQIFVFLFCFFTYSSFFLVLNRLPCSSLVMLDIRVCEHVVVSVAFWMSLHCRWRTKSICHKTCLKKYI